MGRPGPGHGETRRLFIAIDLSPEAVADLAAVVDRLRVSLANGPGHSTRLTRRENWHITVAFLGDVASDRIDAASAVMDAVAAAALPLHLLVAGGGRFGGWRDPILWAGIGGEVDGLRRLARALQRAAHRARLPVDDRPPRPHLTIARPRVRVPAQDVAADVATLQAYAGPQWTATALHLMLSEIEQTPTGPAPTYTPLATASLGPPAQPDTPAP
ncbi:MAG TPA: RNA 2',3'-cyclic phosphodiesterase [Micromonosporaceae bacterium]|jgi:2'-5' RNA ligase